MASGGVGRPAGAGGRERGREISVMLFAFLLRDIFLSKHVRSKEPFLTIPTYHTSPRSGFLNLFWFAEP